MWFRKLRVLALGSMLGLVACAPVGLAPAPGWQGSVGWASPGWHSGVGLAHSSWHGAPRPWRQDPFWHGRPVGGWGGPPYHRHGRHWHAGGWHGPHRGGWHGGPRHRW